MAKKKSDKIYDKFPEKPDWIRTGFIVAIDGPSGAGKSTVSRQLAEILGGMLLDTGGMYRGLAFEALKSETTSEAGLGDLAEQIKFEVDVGTRNLLVNGEDLGNKLRTSEVGDAASKVSRYRRVRSALTKRQRSLARKWSRVLPVVVEGRDIGTIVFPKVPFKFFVTADPEVRAERRLAQLKRQGTKGASLKQVLKENEARDRQDASRKIAPLRCPEDAVIVDTSSMGITQVVRFMHDHIHGKLTLSAQDK